jgi:uncharacterized caspase-like protein
VREDNIPHEICLEDVMKLAREGCSQDHPLGDRDRRGTLFGRGGAFEGLILIAAGLLMLSTAAGHAAAGTARVALVLVAEDYQKLQKSSIGSKRATEIADALTARGFEVIHGVNPSNAAARAYLRDLSTKAEGAEIALAVLIGHGAAWSGQSFFLPANVEIGRGSDLLSRAVSISNIAQIVGRAANGGVFFLMTAPNFGAPIDGLDTRPQFNGDIGKNVFVAFSTSSKVPVSRVDAVGEQTGDALIRVLQKPAPSLKEAMNAGFGDGMGMLVGTGLDMSLAKPAVTVAATSPIQSVAPAPAAESQKPNITDAKFEAERQAREQAERRVRSEQSAVEQAQAELQKAQAEIMKAQADARRAQADAERAQAEAEKAKQEAKRTEAQALLARAQAEALKPASPGPLIEEAQLGQRQRQLIQERLRKLGLYTGPLDAIMGPLTREAIMGFQKSRGAPVTGYLTADQYEVLLSRDERS